MKIQKKLKNKKNLVDVFAQAITNLNDTVPPQAAQELAKEYVCGKEQKEEIL